MPQINISYFGTGITADGADTHDLDVVIEGLKIARKIAADLPPVFLANFTKVFPGTAVATQDQMRDYMKDSAWVITLLALVLFEQIMLLWRSCIAVSMYGVLTDWELWMRVFSQGSRAFLLRYPFI